MVAYEILVSAQGPLVLGFWILGLRVWGLGLTIFVTITVTVALGSGPSVISIFKTGGQQEAEHGEKDCQSFNSPYSYFMIWQCDYRNHFGLQHLLHFFFNEGFPQSSQSIRGT